MPSFGTMTGPGSLTIADDAAAQIILQTASQKASNVLIIAALNQINNTVNRIADRAQSQAKTLSDVDITLSSISTTLSMGSVIAAAAATNQIKTNNFQIAATSEALVRSKQPVPRPPPMEEQITQTVQDALIMNASVISTGALTTFITDQVAAVGVFIASTAIYKTSAAFVQQQISNLTSLIIPPSPAAAASNAAAISGVPTIPGNLG